MQSTSIYKIRGTKVTSPYPVKLTPAETRLIFVLQKYFAPENILADVYFPTTGRSTNMIQIDCLAINQQGIFVFESKDYGGWVFGNGKQRYWTEVTSYGQAKHQFYNPIMQNASHIRAIADLIPTEFTIYSVIVFGTDTTLKNISNIPDHCLVCTHPQILHLLQQISSPHLLQATEIACLRQSLEQARVYPNAVLRNDHTTEIQEKFSKT